MIRLGAAVVAALLAAGIGAGAAPAAIPAPPSVWYGLPGLNAASGAQWARAFAYSTPPNIVYAGLEGGGVFKSTNGGATWSAFNAGFPNPLTTNVRALLSSSTGTTVLAGTDSGVWKSTGGAWQPLAQGPEDDPAKPKKLNESVQSLVALTGQSTTLAGVFSGGVYKSTDDGATWTPPPPNNGMPSSETIYGLTSNVPGLVYATGGSGVYVSTDAGSTWTRKSDGIPGSASPITTWAYPQRPNQLFTSTGSNGIYRSLNAGLTWAPMNTGLGAVRARGLQIFPGSSSQGAHIYAATENGLWEALSLGSAAPPPPRWHEVTEEGLVGPGFSNTIMWALTAPAIPGGGSLGLIAGTQSNGGYFFAFEPPDSPCPSMPNTTTDCPRINDTTPVVGQTLTVANGKWTGTKFLQYGYQWQQCTGSTAGTCSDIDGAEETSYVVPVASSLAYRVEVTATNPAPTFGLVQRFSTITSPAAPNPASYPGYNQTSSPSITVLAPGATTSPQVGDKMYAAYGTTPSASSDGWFNPPATTTTFRWLRCDGSGSDCNEIPGTAAGNGAGGRTYTVQPEDGTHDLRVRVTGSNASGTVQLVSGPSYDVTSLPAAIGDPLPPDEPGGAPKSQAPALAGEAYVGETLAGTVGGWKDPTTDFQRRWVRCDAEGNACTYIQKVASTDPETGPTYVVRADDRGSTLRLRVTADVNNDLTPDGIDNFLPHSVEVDTPPSAVVTDRPIVLPPGGGVPGGGVAGGGPGATVKPGGPGGPGVVLKDTSAPTVSGVRLAKSRFVAGKGAGFRLTVSEAGTVRVSVSKPTRGRRVGRTCKAKTKKNAKRKRCTFQKAVGFQDRRTAAGTVVVPFTGKLGTRKLPRGSYTATIVARDAAGNASKPVTVRFTIVRR